MKNALILLAVILFASCHKQETVIVPPVNRANPQGLLGSWHNDGYYKNFSLEFTPDLMYFGGNTPYYTFRYYTSNDTVFSTPNPLWKFRILNVDTIAMTPISPRPSTRPPDIFYRVK